ncbi:hypothetical protein RhiirC2_774839 [Rhizophagus irregularis]|uniref:Uncharacterized protein n=1 Tax=Rhizophagus irregularis TaxID=588596 RepID=A0A2N1NKK7_9GLOM|nr:hypothetical protein RhiirC2_774839 [Rhizophagus irregularis]
MNHKIELQKLHSDEELFYRIKIFVNDLLTFNISRASDCRDFDRIPLIGSNCSKVQFMNRSYESGVRNYPEKIM